MLPGHSARSGGTQRSSEAAGEAGLSGGSTAACLRSFPSLFYTADVLDALHTRPPPLFLLPAHLWKCHHWKGTPCIIRRTLCACGCDLGQYVMLYMVHMPIVSRDTVAIVTCRAYIPLSSSRQGDNIKDAFSKGRLEPVNLFWVETRGAR